LGWLAEFGFFEDGWVSKPELFDGSGCGVLPFLVEECWVCVEPGAVCWILMGRHATATKRGREMNWSEERGPLSKAKSKSLKFASQPRKNPMVPDKCTEEKLRGSTMYKKMMGRRRRSRIVPGGTTLRIQ